MAVLVVGRVVLAAVGRTRLLTILAVCLLLAVAGVRLSAAGRPALASASTVSGATGAAARARPTLGFEPNRGQLPAGARFAARLPGGIAEITRRGGVRFVAGASTLRLNPIGGRTSADFRPERLLPSRVNSYVGSPSRWRTDIPTFAAIHARSVWPGIDVIYGSSGGQLAIDFALRAGARTQAIGLRAGSVAALRLIRGGDLDLRSGPVALRLLAPRAFQPTPTGIRRPVRAAYTIHNGRIGIRLGHRDSRLPTFIDPIVIPTWPRVGFSTFVGGSGFQDGNALVLAAGNPVIAGQTGTDALIEELSADGQHVLWATVLGGSGTDAARAVAADASGNVYVVGDTTSPNFPVHSAAQSTLGGGMDAFVAGITASGTLSFSTYLGGSGDDGATGIGIGGSPAQLWVAGSTASTNFPAPGARQPSLAGGTDAFVAQYSPAGALGYASYLGGSGQDAATGLAVDDQGNPLVTGTTSSPDFPTQRALQRTLAGPSDLFFAYLAADHSLRISTYFGGSGAEVGGGVALAANNDTGVYLTGTTYSTDFPVKNASEGPHTSSTSSDAVVVRLDASNSGPFLYYSTYLGGTRSDAGLAIATDERGDAYVTGQTQSGDFPVTEQVVPSPPAGEGTHRNAYETELDPQGTVYSSSLIGGSHDSGGRGIAVDANTATAYLDGITASADFPTSNALQPTFGGLQDAFLMRLDQAKPTVTTDPATQRSTTSATLNGTVNPHGAPTDYEIAWGTTPGYGHVLGVTPAGGRGELGDAVQAKLTGLFADTVYHYAVIAQGPAGLVVGHDRTFRTLQAERIAFVRGQNIWVMNADGTDQQQLTYNDPCTASNCSADFSPAFAPDQRQIAFIHLFSATKPGGGGCCVKDSGFSLRVVSPEVGGERTVVPVRNTPDVGAFDYRTTQPTWSPDSQWIAFSFNGISVVRSDGTDRTDFRINDIDPGSNLSLQNGSWPIWTADGKQLLFGTTACAGPGTDFNAFCTGIEAQLTGSGARPEAPAENFRTCLEDYVNDPKHYIPCSVFSAPDTAATSDILWAGEPQTDVRTDCHNRAFTGLIQHQDCPTDIWDIAPGAPGQGTLLVGDTARYGHPTSTRDGSIFYDVNPVSLPWSPSSGMSFMAWLEQWPPVDTSGSSIWRLDTHGNRRMIATDAFDPSASTLACVSPADFLHCQKPVSYVPNENQLQWGQLVVGVTNEETVSVENNGNQVEQFSQPSILQAAGAFTVVVQARGAAASSSPARRIPCAGARLRPRQSCTITVRANPTYPGRLTGYLRFGLKGDPAAGIPLHATGAAKTVQVKRLRIIHAARWQTARVLITSTRPGPILLILAVEPKAINCGRQRRPALFAACHERPQPLREALIQLRSRRVSVALSKLFPHSPPPGYYVIQATAIQSHGVESAPASAAVKVRRHGSPRAAVAKTPPRIKSHETGIRFTSRVVVIPKAIVTANLVGVSASGIFKFKRAAGPLASLRPGKVMLLQGSDAVVVTSISRTHGQLLVHAKAASLTQVISSGKITFSGAPNLRNGFVTPTISSRAGKASDAIVTPGYPYVGAPPARAAGTAFSFTGSSGHFGYSLSFTPTEGRMDVAGVICFQWGSVCDGPTSGVGLEVNISGYFDLGSDSGAISVNGGRVTESSFGVHLNHAHLKLTYTGARGDGPDSGGDPPVFHLPVGIDYTVPGLVPIYLKVQAGLLVKIALSSKNSVLRGGVDYDTSDSGLISENGSNETVSGSGTDPSGNVLDHSDGGTGSTVGIGAGGVVVSVQFPKMGMGLGVRAVNGIGYLDMITSLGQSYAGAVAGGGCKYQLSWSVGGGFEAQLGPFGIASERKILVPTDGNQYMHDFDAPSC